MTKPWEEDWRVEWDENGGYDCITASHDVRRKNGTLVTSLDNGIKHARKESAEHRALASFIAAAPEMARLLLSLEWASEEEGCVACPACRGVQPHTPQAVVTVHPRPRSWPPLGHTEKCPLVLLLRKVGVLP